MASAVNLAAIGERLAGHGMIVRGAFRPEPADDVPGCDEPGGAATVVVIGNAGPAMWRAFAGARPDAASRDPMNDWSGAVLRRIADETGARALFPFAGPPFLPFMRWAQKAESLKPSPIHVLMHPQFGLWHAYRGALVYDRALALDPRADHAHPCDSCADKPCLSACPVDAFDGTGRNLEACVDHIDSAAGADCMSGGCRARLACPIGAEYRYEPEQMQFHMAAFRRVRI